MGDDEADELKQASMKKVSTLTFFWENYQIGNMKAAENYESDDKEGNKINVKPPWNMNIYSKVCICTKIRKKIEKKYPKE